MEPTIPALNFQHISRFFRFISCAYNKVSKYILFIEI